jgi:antitoxin PrlF
MFLSPHTESSPMALIKKMATVTSKGQVTLPLAIRQALHIEAGSKLAFVLDGDRLSVAVDASTDAEDVADPAIGAFLQLLENDIRRGKNISDLPAGLMVSLSASLERPVDLTQDISGDVEL